MVRILFLLLMLTISAKGKNAFDVPGFFKSGRAKTTNTEKKSHNARTTTTNHPPRFTRGDSQTLSTCENVNFVPINYLLAIIDSDIAQPETWTRVYGPFHGLAVANYSATSTGAVITPTGLIYAPDTGYTGMDTLGVSISDGISSDTTYVYITVHSLPSAGIITGPGDVCRGSSIMLSDSLMGGTWSISNNRATISDSGRLASIKAGLDTVKYTLPGIYCSNSVTRVISIDTFPATPGRITGSSSVCKGGETTLYPIISGGYWSVTNGNISDSAGTVKGISQGLDTIIYTIANACGDTSTKFAMTVTIPLNPGTITGSDSLCTGDSIRLTDTVSGGKWNTNNSHAIVSGGEVFGISQGAVIVSFVLSNACGNFVTTHNIKVLPQPDPGIIIGPAGLCSGDSVTLTDNKNTGVWMSENTLTTLVPITNGCVVTGVSAGTNIISYAATNSCGTIAAVQNLTISPLPDSPVITNNANVLYAAPGYSSYQWFYNGSPIIGATFDSCYVGNTGAYSVMVTNNTGCSATSAPLACTGCSLADLLVFPNPAVSMVYFQWCSPLKVILTYMDGRSVKIMENTNELDISPMPEGLYLYSLYDSNGGFMKAGLISKVE